MSTLLATVTEEWEEVGVDGVRPALGGPEYLLSQFEGYVRDGLLNVYRYEIDKSRAQRQELRYLERKVEDVDWDNTGSAMHRHLMAVVSWHIANEAESDYLLGRAYPAGGHYFDVADVQYLLPFEVGEYGEPVKVESLLQAGQVARAPKRDMPTPNGVQRIAFVPYPESKSAAMKSSATFPVFVFTKEWID